MDKLKLSVFWYIIGIGFIGIAVGYFVALSNSPVIATLIPLIFGLLGGSSGLLLVRINSNEESSYTKLKYIGISFIVFSVAVISSSWYALEISSRHTNFSEYSLSIEDIKPDFTLDLLVLRKKMQLLGATSHEQKVVLNKYISGQQIHQSTNDEISTYISRLSIHGKVIKSLIDKTIQGTDKNDANTNDLLITRKLLKTLFYAQDTFMKENKSLPLEVINNIVTKLTDHVEQNIRDYDSDYPGNSLVARSPELILSMLKLKALLTTDVPSFSNYTKYYNIENIKSLDNFTDKLISTRPKNEIDLSHKFAYEPTDTSDSLAPGFKLLPPKIKG